MKISDRGAAFIASHEGVVTKAYRDPVGILTIGVGFTMRSSAFSAWWRKSRGHDLRLGDTMTKAECNEVLAIIIDAEYAPPVQKMFGEKLRQYQFDAAVSVVYNCGAGTLTDRWAKALAAGDVAGAANYLRSTRITANGKRLQGLVNRRADEAKLLERGDYGSVAVAADTSRVDLIREGQALLAQLGYAPGPTDGIEGERTRAAALAYQRTKPDLVDDGRIGPATLSALRIDVAANTGANPNPIAKPDPYPPQVEATPTRGPVDDDDDYVLVDSDYRPLPDYPPAPEAAGITGPVLVFAGIIAAIVAAVFIVSRIAG